MILILKEAACLDCGSKDFINDLARAFVCSACGRGHEALIIESRPAYHRDLYEDSDFAWI